MKPVFIVALLDGNINNHKEVTNRLNIGNYILTTNSCGSIFLDTDSGKRLILNYLGKIETTVYVSIVK